MATRTKRDAIEASANGASLAVADVVAAPTKKPAFDAQAFLDSAGVSRRVVEFRRAETIYSQGDPARHVIYIQKGGVQLSVISPTGKEAVVAVLGPGDFFGESSLAGHSVRMGTATALTPTTALVIDKNEMLRVLHAEHDLSDRFISYVLARNIRVEEDLIDQLFNSSGNTRVRCCCSPATANSPGPAASRHLSGDARGNGRHHSVANQLLHEQVQETGLHRVRRRDSR
jgi:CRP-like cAMP-binding protein